LRSRRQKIKSQRNHLKHFKARSFVVSGIGLVFQLHNRMQIDAKTASMSKAGISSADSRSSAVDLKVSSFAFSPCEMTSSQIIRESNGFRVTQAAEAVCLLNEYEGELSPSSRPITVIELFRRTVETFPDRVALMTKDASDQEWRPLTYRAYKERVDHVAKVFLKLGLVRHGTVAVFAFNCAEWLIAELAAIHAG
jgi:AMP-binding enzyme